MARKPRKKGTITWNVSDHVRSLYEAISKEFNISVFEISRIIHAAVAVDMDPINPTGKVFVFQSKRPGKKGELPDFRWINEELPEPYDVVDLIEARKQFGRDAKTANWILETKPTPDELVRVYRNTTGWCRFWAVRAPTPEMRSSFQRALDATAAEEARARQSAARQLKRLGIDVEARHEA